MASSAPEPPGVAAPQRNWPAIGVSWMLAFLPIAWQIRLAVEALAGKDTSVTVGVTASLTLGVSGLGGWLVVRSLRKKLEKQHDELVRIRERLRNFEARNDELLLELGQQRDIVRDLLTKIPKSGQ